MTAVMQCHMQEAISPVYLPVDDARDAGGGVEWSLFWANKGLAKILRTGFENKPEIV